MSKEHTMSKHQHRHDGEPQWHVDIDLSSDGHATAALAELFIGDAVYEAYGQAHTDAIAPTLADKLAVARALSSLAHQLINDASHEVDRAAHALEDSTSDLDVARSEAAATR
jgi:hypothetical protein